MYSNLLEILLCLLLVSALVHGVRNEETATPIVYTSSSLRALNTPPVSSRPRIDDLPKEMKPRKRGKAGGLKKRIKARKFRPYIPTLIMGNVQSLQGKIDELSANCRYFENFRTCSLMSFTETWLNSSINDGLVNVEGFKLLRGDRDLDATGKKSGGGVCLYVNEAWCHPNNAHLKSFHCSQHAEILVVNLRPYYLPREITKVVHVTVYIPDASHGKPAVDELIAVLKDIETANPDALIMVDGDFNRCPIDRRGLHLHQHVKCPTRGEATLDLCYTNIKDAYTAKPLTRLGRSDHDLLMLQPKYRPLVQRQKPRVINIEQWSPEVVNVLQGSLDCTDWDVFIDNTSSLDELTDTVTEYIKFCKDTVVPTKKVKVYPNNKPWISKDIKQIINRKKQVFGSRNREQLKRIQKELDSALYTGRNEYRKKIEEHFRDNNMKQVWNGMRLMSGFNLGSGTKSSKLPNVTEQYAEDLNGFYNRFDQHDFSIEHSDVKNLLSACPTEPVLEVTEEDVRREFSKKNVSKSTGPDGLTPRILKQCANQLARIFMYIFNTSFKTKTVPSIWKKSCIVPVPKSPTVNVMNDLRPVALTSEPMKSCERFVLNFLKSKVSEYLDPLQFAYRAGRSCEDAILYTIEKIYSHLEHSRHGNTVRIMFFDFSSAFNTIQPHVLVNKMLEMNSVPKWLISWIFNYLTERSQFVRLAPDLKSSVINSNTGAPQGTVLAPFLFTLYTSDARSTHSACPLIKFADDSALVGLIKNDDSDIYVSQIESFVKYCDDNYLVLNVKKTKEMIMDFRTKQKSVPVPIEIKNSNVERISQYKYLGVVFDDFLTWHPHINYTMKKISPRLYCFRKLSYFKVDPKILKIFFQSVICSVWKYCFICWGGNAFVTDLSKIQVVINRVCKVIGECQSVDSYYCDLVGRTLHRVMDDDSHPLHDVLRAAIIPRSGRMRLPHLVTNRHSRSFIPMGIRKHNEEYGREDYE